MHSLRNAAPWGLGLATLALLGLAPRPAAAQTAYGVTFLDEQLISINEATGVGTLIGPLNTGVTPFGLAFNNNRLLTFDGGTDTIDQIDPATGATIATIATTTGPVLGQGGFAVGPDGFGYLTTALDPATFNPVNDLYRINLTTGAATLVQNTAPTLEAIAFGPTGTLYGLGKLDNNLYTISTINGTTTLVGSTGVSSGSPVGGLTFDGGTLLGTIDDALYTIDPATGTATPVPAGTTGTQIASADGTMVFSSISGLAVAPEPSQLAGLALGALGLAGLGWKARRRKPADH